MRHSTVICHDCGKTMVPRTTYSRGFWGYTPGGNHCPFCLSDNWDGSALSFGMKLFWLLGVALGILACVLVGASLFKMQRWAGIEDTYPWLTLLTDAIAVISGYRFYKWFTAWESPL